MPRYFGNVCLRFIPVFDIVVHRFLEIPQVATGRELHAAETSGIVVIFVVTGIVSSQLLYSSWPLLSQVNKSLETLFDHLGCLYKFHHRPMTYLYNTLHYYENRSAMTTS